LASAARSGGEALTRFEPAAIRKSRKAGRERRLSLRCQRRLRGCRASR